MSDHPNDLLRTQRGWDGIRSLHGYHPFSSNLKVSIHIRCQNHEFSKPTWMFAYGYWEDWSSAWNWFSFEEMLRWQVSNQHQYSEDLLKSMGWMLHLTVFSSSNLDLVFVLYFKISISTMVALWEKLRFSVDISLVSWEWSRYIPSGKLVVGGVLMRLMWLPVHPWNAWNTKMPWHFQELGGWSRGNGIEA